MSASYSPYQRSQSGTQRKVTGKGDGRLQRGLLQADSDTCFSGGFEIQSPGARLSDTQAYVLSSIMRSLTGNASLSLDVDWKRLYPIVRLENSDRDMSVVLFIRQPTIHTATLHTSGCPQTAVDMATSQLSKVTGSPGACRVTRQGQGLYSLMGKYACTMYDLISQHCDTCTMKVSMVSVGESALCGYVRIDDHATLVTLSFECMQMIVAERPELLHCDRCTSATLDRLDVRARNEEYKGTRLSLYPDGYMKGTGRLDLLLETYARVNTGLMGVLASDRAQKFLNMLTVSPSNP